MFDSCFKVCNYFCTAKVDPGITLQYHITLLYFISYFTLQPPKMKEPKQFEKENETCEKLGHPNKFQLFHIRT